MKHKYSHELFVHREPVGQSVSLLHVYEHNLFLQLDPPGQSLSSVQRIVTDSAPLLELDDETSTGTPSKHVCVFGLQLNPLGQALLFIQRYSQSLLPLLPTQFDPNGQSPSSLHEYLHSPPSHLELFGQALSFIQFTLLPPLELGPAVGPPEPLNGFPKGTPFLQIF